MTKVIQDKEEEFTGTNRADLDTKNPTGGETIPLAPSGSVSTGISSSVNRTTWVDNSDNETGFEVHGSDTENGTYTLLDTVGAGVTVYDEEGLSTSQTRWYKERAVNAAGDSAFSNKDSATTTTAPSAPGAPTQFLVVDNEDGTCSITFTLADDTNTASETEIWKDDTNEWVDLTNLNSTPTVEFINNVTTPAATGATVNPSGEFGMRQNVSNETGFSVSNEYWTQVTDIGGSSLTAGTLVLTTPDTATTNSKFGTLPTNYTGVQLQRVLTADEVGPENWADVEDADTIGELTGDGWDDTVTVDVEYSYRIEVTDGVDTVYTPIQRTTAGTILMSEDFESGAIQYTGSSPYPGSGAYFTNDKAGHPTESYPPAASIESTAEAADSITGSTKSLRTFYESASFSDNTTILKLPTGYDELFIRIYVKWGSNWSWPGDQQKFLKTRSSDEAWSQNYQIKRYVSPDYLVNYPPEDGITIGSDTHAFQLDHNYFGPDNDGREWIYQNRSTAHSIRGSDSLNNGIGDPAVDSGDGNFLFAKEQWYSWELQIKANTITPSVLNDGINRIWIDGNLMFESTDLVIKKTTGKIDTLELQHVYQPFTGGSGGYSYMDNIVVSDKYIGPEE